MNKQYKEIIMKFAFITALLLILNDVMKSANLSLLQILGISAGAVLLDFALKLLTKKLGNRK